MIDTHILPLQAWLGTVLFHGHYLRTKDTGINVELAQPRSASVLSCVPAFESPARRKPHAPERWNAALSFRLRRLTLSPAGRLTDEPLPHSGNRIAIVVGNHIAAPYRLPTGGFLRLLFGLKAALCHYESPQQPNSSSSIYRAAVAFLRTPYIIRSESARSPLYRWARNSPAGVKKLAALRSCNSPARGRE